MLASPLTPKCIPCPEVKPKVITPLVTELCPKPVETEKPALLGVTNIAQVETDLYPEHIRKLFNDFDCTADKMIGDVYRVPQIRVPPPASEIDKPYTFKFTTEYGEGPFEYTVFLGELPAGLELNLNGVLSGTPTVGGNYNVTIKSKDNRGNSNKMIVTFKVLV